MAALVAAICQTVMVTDCGNRYVENVASFVGLCFISLWHKLNDVGKMDLAQAS